MTARRPLASPKEVAEYLQVSRRTLDDWAFRGTGPRFVLVGQQRRYRWTDVNRWLRSRPSGPERRIPA